MLLASYTCTCTLQGSAKEYIESLGYTSREIKTVACMHTYVTISVQLQRSAEGERDMGGLFRNVDVMFLANTKTQKPGNLSYWHT